MSELEQRIASLARELGFAGVGFAEAGESLSIGEYRDWLAAGCAADMAWLERHAELKTDPRRIAEGARSVIAVAARYPTNRAPGSGISTYALGGDYHDVIRRKLKLLAQQIGTPLATARVCVDSAPLLEREWAVRAGIGWQGRQGQIVSREAGCCIVLGFLLVDLELAPSPRQPNRCGTCRRCLDACPTGAALGHERVDARRCISYLTIEREGEIPPELTPAVSGALFGCDRCTAVCPWNRFGEELVMPEFRPASPPPHPNEILAMTEEEFERGFKGTALHRTGLPRLQRNARLADAPTASNVTAPRESPGMRDTP